MSCESIRAELVAYLQDELAAARRAEVREHLSGCRECAAELDGFQSAQKAVRSLALKSASGDFEERVRERIARKVEELRAQGSVRFRTGRERADEARRWPGLRAWLARRKRAAVLFLLAAALFVPAAVLVYRYLVVPHFARVEEESRAAREEMDRLRKNELFHLRRQARRLELAATADGVVRGLGLLGDQTVRLVPVLEPDRGVLPGARCVFVYDPAQWQAFLARGQRLKNTPFEATWRAAVDSAGEVRAQGGSLYLPPQCFQELLGSPGAVSALLLPDHAEIWDPSDLDEYLRLQPSLAPPPAGAR